MTPKPKVYRVRNFPSHVDKHAAIELLLQCLGDIGPDEIQMPSLATDVGMLRSRHKVATVTFNRQPKLLDSGKNEYKMAVIGLEDPLIIDDHFDGVTPLNNVTYEAHSCE